MCRETDARKSWSVQHCAFTTSRKKKLSLGLEGRRSQRFIYGVLKNLRQSSSEEARRLAVSVRRQPRLFRSSPIGELSFASHALSQRQSHVLEIFGYLGTFGLRYSSVSASGLLRQLALR